MSRQDPGAATGQQTYVKLGRCTCAHSAYVHDINSRGFRARCSAGTPERCPCKLFVAEGADRG